MCGEFERHLQTLANEINGYIIKQGDYNSPSTLIHVIDTGGGYLCLPWAWRGRTRCDYIHAVYILRASRPVTPLLSTPPFSNTLWKIERGLRYNLKLTLTSNSPGCPYQGETR